MNQSTDQSRKIETRDGNVICSILGDNNNISGTIAQTISQLPSSSDPNKPDIKGLLTQLEEAISGSEDLDEKRKAKALKQVEALAKAAQNPTDEDMKEKAEDANTMLEGIISKLPAAAALVTICKNVLPAIAQFFGL